MWFDHPTICSMLQYNRLTNSSGMFFKHRTCAGQQTGAKPRPQESVGKGFVNLSGAAQQDL